MRSLAEMTVLIVDDFTLAREGLAAQLASHCKTVRGASNLPSLVKEAAGGGVDLILLQIGSAASQTLLQISLDLVPPPAVIVYGLSEEREWEVVSVAEAGAAGLHLRSESFAHLLEMMQGIGEGKARCSAEVSSILLGQVYTGALGYRDAAMTLLTARESEILALLENGLTNKEIAARLCVTVHTVKNHVHSVLGKLGVQSRNEAIRLSRATRYAGGPDYQTLKRSLTSVQ